MLTFISLPGRQGFHLKNDIVIINDGTLDTDNSYRNAQDILYSIENLSNDEDLFVVNCDSVFTFKIRNFWCMPCIKVNLV